MDSPLCPDGLFSPEWMRRHMREPSAVIGFHELWDWSDEPDNPTKTKREVGPLTSQVLIDPMERQKDAALSQELNDRRKQLQEKGVKFAAVIILKDKHLSNVLNATPAKKLMEKIRRRVDPGTLKPNTKAIGAGHQAFFFYSSDWESSRIAGICQYCQRSQDNMNGSRLSRLMHEPAIQFYNNKIKKARKKKSKLPSPGLSTAASTSNEPQPLPPRGWLLRYDLKIAIFQELKQDIESAVKSYEHVYAQLGDLIGPASHLSGDIRLPVRGKRWWEARELADCVNFKICRIYICLNDPTSALTQMNGHLHLFQSYSSTWGMGEQSFEYWAWLSKQVFADVLDAAVQCGFKIPLATAYLHPAGSSNLPGSPLLGATGGGYDIGNSMTGCNPGAILQHAGFYYQLAAKCCAERRRRFLELENGASPTLGLSASVVDDEAPATSLATLLANERRVDHSNLTIELLTKSYEQFKRCKSGRMTLYLAAEIAGTYYETGKYEMALKFFERIGKTYRKENWHMVLTSILRWSLRCAKELGSWERTVECLVELMADTLPVAEQKREEIQRELMDILDKKEKPPLVINMDQINAFVLCDAQFQKDMVSVDTALRFQVTLKTNAQSPPLPFRFGSLRILFNDPQYNHILMDNHEEADSADLLLLDCSDRLTKVTEGEYTGWYTASTNLAISRNQTKVYQGTIMPNVCGDMKILGVCLDIVGSSWSVGLNYSFDSVADSKLTSRRRWYEIMGDKEQQRPKLRFLEGKGELTCARVIPCPPRIKLAINYNPPALLDEHFALKVTVASHESEPIDLTLSVHISNAEGKVTNDYVLFSDEDDVKLPTRDFAVGLLKPQETRAQDIYLHANSIAGSRFIDVKARYSFAVSDVEGDTEFMEKHEQIEIPFVAPFNASFELHPQSESTYQSLSPELSRVEKWLVVAAIQCCAESDLEIFDVQLKQDISTYPDVSLTPIAASNESAINNDHQRWKAGHIYNMNYLLKVHIADVTELQPYIPMGSISIRWKRYGDEGPMAMTELVLPKLPFQQQHLIVNTDCSAEMYVGEPFTLTFTVYNPTVQLTEYSVAVEFSDAFVFSGYKQCRGRLFPLSRTSYHYTCYPLLAGKVQLPRLKLTARQQGTETEVPVEFLGTGAVAVLNQPTQPNEKPQQQIVGFVNARRYF
ncbi:hypothetical protein EC973_005523 [Apophysomyces ossiformis]|uniref:Trafficking protein particle complex subunit 11 n=1 Tax=Apophysomyces ossiformis TaxID=679940 RepID=A0A8H7BK91_9FUNG|nr:hypothetical protein EC973_005523 [Apophysomyces ossiformis]